MRVTVGSGPPRRGRFLWLAMRLPLALLAAVVLPLLGPGQALAAGCSTAPSGTAVSTWPGLQTDFTSGGAYYLTASVTETTRQFAGNHLAVGSGKSVTLDLCGYNLTVTDPGSDGNGGGLAAINVPSGATLRIEDTSTGIPGTVTATGGAGITSGGGGAGIGGNGGDFGDPGLPSGTIDLDGGTIDNPQGGSGYTPGAGGGAGIGGGGGGFHAAGGAAGPVLVAGAAVLTPEGGQGGGGVSLEGGGGAGVGGGGAGNDAAGGAGASVSSTSCSAGGLTLAGGSLTDAEGGAPGGGNAAAGYGIGDGGNGDAFTGGRTGGGSVVAASGTTLLSGGIDASLFVCSGATLAVPASQTLTLDDKTLNSLTSFGTILVSGQLEGAGTLYNGGSISLSGGGTIPGNGVGAATGDLQITGTIYELSFPSGTTPSTLWVYAPTVYQSGETLPVFSSGGQEAEWEDASGVPEGAGTPLSSLYPESFDPTLIDLYPYLLPCFASTPPADAVPVPDWASLQDDFQTGGTYFLTGSLTESGGGQLAVPLGESVTLDLCGSNLSVTGPGQDASGAGLAAINVPAGQTPADNASLTIEDTSSNLTADQGTVTVAGGVGKLNVGVGGGAGIGGKGADVDVPGQSAGTITLTGGTVNATGGGGGSGGAGIGGGGGGAYAAGGNGGQVTLSGGSVIGPTGGTGGEGGGAAGIGGGGGGFEASGGGGGQATLAGASVTAATGGLSTEGGAAGPGIGGGGAGQDSSSVTVAGGGSVQATPGTDSTLAGSTVVGGSSFVVDQGATVTVPEDASLALDDADTSASGNTNSGTIALSGTLTGTGALNNAGSIVVSGGAWTIPGNGTTAGGLQISGNIFDLRFPSGTAPTDLWVYAPSTAAGGEALPTPPPEPGYTASWLASNNSPVATGTDLTGLSTTGDLVPLSAGYVDDVAALGLSGPGIGGQAAAVAGQSATYTLTALDAGGNTVSASTDPITVTTSSGTVTHLAAALAGGQASFSVDFTGAGSRSITVTDAADNVSRTFTVTVNPAVVPALIVNPKLIATLTSVHPERNGWYRAPVTVTFTCTKGSAQLSGACPTPVTLSASGARQTLARTINAADGGTATVTAGPINIDLGHPRIRLHGLGAHPASSTQSPHITCTATAISGISGRCRVRVSVHGAVVTYRAVATSVAGTTTVVTGHRTL